MDFFMLLEPRSPLNVNLAFRFSNQYRICFFSLLSEPNMQQHTAGLVDNPLANLGRSGGLIATMSVMAFDAHAWTNRRPIMRNGGSARTAKTPQTHAWRTWDTLRV